MGGDAGLQASPGETHPRRVCEGLGAPPPPPLLPEARPETHSSRGSRSPPPWSGSRSAAAAGQELVALRAALAELRCWGVELAEGSRRPWGRLLLAARCYGSEGENSISVCLPVGFSVLSFCFLLSALRLKEETAPGSFSPPPTCHWSPYRPGCHFSTLHPLP